MSTSVLRRAVLVDLDNNNPDQALDRMALFSQAGDPIFPGAPLPLAAKKGGQNDQNASGVPNVYLTSQDNPQVNCLQLGIDGPAASIKEQHFTTQRPVDTGRAGRLVMNPGASHGANQNGAAVYISDGLSTGNVAGEGIGFQLARAGAAGSTMNTRSDAFAMVDVGGFSAFYPAAADNGFLGLDNRPWYYAYVQNLFVKGGAGFWGSTPPASKPAAPSTVAGVVSVLQAYGLCA